MRKSKSAVLTLSPPKAAPTPSEPAPTPPPAPQPEPYSNEPPPLKQEWPMFLGYSESVEFLKIECRLREREAFRYVSGQRPKIALAKDTGVGFKRWHLRTMLDFRRRLFDNRVEGNDEG